MIINEFKIFLGISFNPFFFQELTYVFRLSVSMKEGANDILTYMNSYIFLIYFLVFVFLPKHIQNSILHNFIIGPHKWVFLLSQYKKEWPNTHKHTYEEKKSKQKSRR